MWEFFAVHFWTIIASLGGLGLIALVALFVLLGWSFGGVLTAALSLAKAIVKFFETPLGEVVGIIILCVVVWFTADIRRTRIDAEAREIAVQNALATAAETAEKNRIERDADVKQEVQADANRKIDALAAEKNELAERAREYEAKLSKRPDCIVGDDDLAADRVRRKPK